MAALPTENEALIPPRPARNSAPARLALGLCAAAAVAAGLLVAWRVYFPEWQASRSDLPALERLATDEAALEPVHYHLGRALLAVGRASESYAAFSRAVALAPGSVRCRAGEVEALLAMGRWEEADRRLAGWPPEQAGGVEPALLRARLLLLGRHQPEPAIRLLEPLVRRHPSRADLRYLLGRAYAAVYKPREALAAFREAAKLEPDRAEYHRELAQAYLFSSRFNEATQSLRRAEALAPSDPTTLAILGQILAATAQSAEQQQAARETLDRAAALRPGDGEIRCELGQLSQNMREFGEAARHFEACLAIDPSHFDALYRLAQCRLRQGDEPGGERLMRTYERVAKLSSVDVHTFAAAGRVLPPEKWQAIAAVYRRNGLAALAQAASDRAASAVAVPDSASVPPSGSPR